MYLGNTTQPNQDEVRFMFPYLIIIDCKKFFINIIIKPDLSNPLFCETCQCFAGGWGSRNIRWNIADKG